MKMRSATRDIHGLHGLRKILVRSFYTERHVGTYPEESWQSVLPGLYDCHQLCPLLHQQPPAVYVRSGGLKITMVECCKVHDSTSTILMVVVAMDFECDTVIGVPQSIDMPCATNHNNQNIAHTCLHTRNDTLSC